MGKEQNKMGSGRGISKEAKEAGRKVKAVCKRQWNKLIGCYDEFMDSIDYRMRGNNLFCGTKCEKNEKRSIDQVLDDIQEDLYRLGDLVDELASLPSKERALEILQKGIIFHKSGIMEGLDVRQILSELGYEE
jgi:hypothetical protein